MKKFANHSKDNEIYPLTITEIVDAQKADNKLKEFFKPNATLDKGLEPRIIEDQNISVTKKGWSYPSLCNSEQRCGTNTISSIRGTTVSKGQ